MPCAGSRASQAAGAGWSIRICGRCCAVLDFYLALLLSLSGILYRMFGRHADPEAFPIWPLWWYWRLSTYAQCLFGLDWPGGWSAIGCYRCAAGRPAAKDCISFVALVLVAALDPARRLRRGIGGTRDWTSRLDLHAGAAEALAVHRRHTVSDRTAAGGRHVRRGYGRAPRERAIPGTGRRGLRALVVVLRPRVGSGAGMNTRAA